MHTYLHSFPLTLNPGIENPANNTANHKTTDNKCAVIDPRYNWPQPRKILQISSLSIDYVLF
jgi:hypothetical protein